MKSWQWNPSSYNATGNVAFMLSENYEPLNKRLVNIGKKLSQFKAYYEAAKRTLQIQPMSISIWQWSRTQVALPHLRMIY